MDKLKSISTRILISYLIVVVFTFLITALAFYPMMVGVLGKRAEIGLEKQAWEIAYTIGSSSLLPHEHNLPLTILLLGRSIESNFLWIDPQDKISFSSRPEQFPVGQSIAHLPEMLREDNSFNRNKANIFKSERYLSVEVPVGAGGTVLTFVSINTLQAMYKETLLMIFGSLLAALMMALLIAFFIISYLVKPLRALEDYARAVGNRQFDIRLDLKSNDELAKLGTAFNQMADRLKSYDEGRHRFFQNASHEMKTPLMSINGYAEGIRDGLFTGPALDNALEIIHRESLRLRNIVENMIDITILEQPHNSYFLPHDLCYLIEQVLETVGGYAVERRIEVESAIEAETWVIGDWDQLNSLLVNLLSNAIRHARSRVIVQSLLLEGKNQVLIKVEDDGAGFSSEDLAHAFDYFYTTAESGSGLGLTIVQKIVEEHEGTITLYNTSEGGAAAEIVLPVLPDGQNRRSSSSA
ncbi:MAG: ATP-binding protein [Syntrophomonadaceae bacterium]|nr:ATP-binding protein [Syntrophomonadaceae bacterium]